MNSNKYFTFNSLFTTIDDESIDNVYKINESNTIDNTSDEMNKGIVDYLLYGSIVLFCIAVIACIMLIGYIK